MTGPDRNQVARAFRRAAGACDSVDFLHTEISARTLTRLDPLRIAPARIVDLGAGPPAATAAIAARFPQSLVLAIDLAPEILGVMPQPWCRLCADAQGLPLPDASIDLVHAGMLLHWCAEPTAALLEARRVLQPPGLLLFSTLGPETLKELRSCWARVDDRSHVLPFADMHNLGDALLAAGFAEPVLDRENLTITYPDMQRIAGDLRAVGAADLSRGRRKTLTGRGRWNAMAAAYEKLRNEAGLLPVTIEVIYGHAWTAARTDATSHEIAVPLEKLLHRR